MDIGLSKFNTRMHEATKSFGILGGDIFCFYKLCVDLPTSFFSDLGETGLVTYKQECEIKEFLLLKYPQIAKKKFSWRISYQQTDKGEQYNVIPEGSQAPRSKCCIRSVKIQLNSQLGGKVACLNPLCANNPMELFNIPS